MITAVDTSVLIDLFIADPACGTLSANALRLCFGEGQVIACEVVWAETAAVFPSAAGARDAMDALGVEFSAINLDSALAAASAWKRYRAKGGRRQRVAADFLIGAHARLQADRLLTRDQGFFRTYFAGLSVIDPVKL